MVATQDSALTAAHKRDYQIDYPPTGLWSDEPEMESDLHLQQMLLLISCLEMLWADRSDFYLAGNVTVYYSPEKIKIKDFRGPDFFVVLNTERRARRSWTVWEEQGNYPNLIIEILSDSTAKVDRTTKKDLYQNTFRTPEYFWFDPWTLEFEGFCLLNGKYNKVMPSPNGLFWSEQLQLFLGIHQSQVRYFTPDGELVPTPIEAAGIAQEKAQVAQEKAQAAQEKVQTTQQQNDLLAAKLRELGIDPDTL